MTFRTWLSPRVLTACGLLAAWLVVLSLPTSATTKSRCEELREWASAYEGTTPTLDEIARFDRAERIAIFNAVSPDVRAGLWQEQLRRFSQRPELSTTQRALIAEGIELATSRLYAREESARESFRRFWPRAEAAFTSAEHLRAWGDLGSVVSTAERAADTVHDPSKSQSDANAFGVTCVCSTSHPSAQCSSGVCNQNGCSFVLSGCGLMWDKPCNGLCAN